MDRDNFQIETQMREYSTPSLNITITYNNIIYKRVVHNTINCNINKILQVLQQDFMYLIRYECFILYYDDTELVIPNVDCLSMYSPEFYIFGNIEFIVIDGNIKVCHCYADIVIDLLLLYKSNNKKNIKDMKNMRNKRDMEAMVSMEIIERVANKYNIDISDLYDGNTISLDNRKKYTEYKDIIIYDLPIILQLCEKPIVYINNISDSLHHLIINNINNYIDTIVLSNDVMSKYSLFSNIKILVQNDEKYASTYFPRLEHILYVNIHCNLLTGEKKYKLYHHDILNDITTELLSSEQQIDIMDYDNMHDDLLDCIKNINDV